MRGRSGGRKQPDLLADEGTPSFFAFEGMARAGSFYLALVDDSPEEAGVLNGSSVYLENPLRMAIR